MLHRVLVAVLAIAALVTIPYYVNGVDWSFAIKTHSLGSAAFTFGALTGLALLPYAWLWRLLGRRWSHGFLPITAVILVVASAPTLLFWVWRDRNTTDGGGRYLVMPIIQLTLLLVISLLAPLFIESSPSADDGP